MYPPRPYWAQQVDGLGYGVGQWKSAGTARSGASTEERYIERLVVSYGALKRRRTQLGCARA